VTRSKARVLPGRGDQGAGRRRAGAGGSKPGLEEQALARDTRWSNQATVMERIFGGSADMAMTLLGSRRWSRRLDSMNESHPEAVEELVPS